jgi:hypothetical protein
MTEEVAPRARFELATLPLTAEEVKNLSAASGVAYRKFGAILASLVAPKPAPKKQSESTHNITAMSHNAVPG